MSHDHTTQPLPDPDPFTGVDDPACLQAADPAIALARRADELDISFDHIVHAAREGLIVVDAHNTIVLLNQAAHRMFGRAARDMLGRGLEELIVQRDLQVVDRQLEHLRDKDAQLPAIGPSLALHGRRANGQEFAFLAALTRCATPDNGGVHPLVAILVSDSEALQALQRNVDATERHTRTVFDLAPTAAWITEDDTIVLANRACLALFGAGERRSLIGLSIYTLLSPDAHQAVRAGVATALSSGLPVPAGAHRATRLDGQRRDIEIAIAPLPAHGPTVVQMVITDCTERARVRAELEQSRALSRRLSANLVQSREAERHRIACELHDELGQRLTALQMELAGMATAPLKVVRQRTRVMDELLVETIAAVRRIATDLRPLMLDDLGLCAAIEWLARESERRMAIRITLELEEAELDAGGDDTSVAIYRIVQECLTNIARHAKARTAHIALRRSTDGGALLLTVADDGVGIAPDALQRDGSLGLLGIRERAEFLGGTLAVDNLPQGGTRLQVRLPCPAPRDAGAVPAHPRQEARRP